MIERMTLDEYLGRHDVGFPCAGTSLDKCRFPHGLSKRQHQKMMKDNAVIEEQYSKKREKCTREYYILLPDLQQDDQFIYGEEEPDNGNLEEYLEK